MTPGRSCAECGMEIADGESITWCSTKNCPELKAGSRSNTPWRSFDEWCDQALIEANYPDVRCIPQIGRLLQGAWNAGRITAQSETALTDEKGRPMTYWGGAASLDKLHADTPRTNAHLSHLNLPDGRKVGIPDQTVALLRELERQSAGAVTKEMVDRFLSWRLPKDFSPDNGISFKPIDHPHGLTHLWPTGTNLLNADQAKAMLEHVLAVVQSAELPRSAVFNAYVEFFEAWRALNALPWFKDGRNNAEREAASNRLDDAYTGIVEATDGRVIPSVVQSATVAPIPTKRTNEDRSDWYGSGYVDGWNACVDRMRNATDSGSANV
jgi:hypothetical protein